MNIDKLNDFIEKLIKDYKQIKECCICEYSGNVDSSLEDLEKECSNLKEEYKNIIEGD